MSDEQILKNIKAGSIVIIGIAAIIFLPYIIGNFYTYNSPIDYFGKWMMGAITIMGVAPVVYWCYRFYVRLKT